MTKDELVEAVARAIFDQQGYEADEIFPSWSDYVLDARAAIRIVLEEAAKEVRAYLINVVDDETADTVDEILRALKPGDE